MDNTTKGIIGVITLLTLFGGYIVLTPEQEKNSYVCMNEADPVWGVFYGGISASGLRAYPDKGTTLGYKDCRGGQWVKLTVYAELKGYSLEEAVDNLQTTPQTPVLVGGPVKYLCNLERCIVIEE